MNVRPSLLSSSRLLPLLLAALCALALPACKAEKDPRKDFKDAVALFSHLERASPDRCYLDPRMGKVEELFKSIPPESPDYSQAQGFLKRIQANRERLNATQANASDIKEAPATNPKPGTAAAKPPAADAPKAATDETAADKKAADDVPNAALDGDDARIAKAKSLFEHYVRLEQDYDSILVDLYADNAKMHISSGKRNDDLPLRRFRTNLIKGLGTARKMNARTEYSNVAYKPEGSDRVLITMTRSSPLDGTGPASMLVGPGRGKEWLIYQHSIEQHPQASSGKRR